MPTVRVHLVDGPLAGQDRDIDGTGVSGDKAPMVCRVDGHRYLGLGVQVGDQPGVPEGYRYWPEG